MLQNTQIEYIAKLLKIEAKTLADAITSDKEVEVDISPDLQVMDKDEMTKFESNYYNKGKKSGIEMVIKDYAKNNGLEGVGKTLDSLIEVTTKKVLEEAKLEVPEQVNTAKQQFKKLQEQYKELEKTVQEKDGIINKVSGEADLYRAVPTLGDGFLPINKLTTLMKADGYEFVKEDGKLVAKFNNEPLTTATGEFLPIDEVMKKYSTENKLHTAPSTDANPAPPKGRGGADSPKNVVFTKRTELEQHFKEQGKSIQGQEFTNAIRSLRKENPDFNVKE